jgi:hypothetical protein
MKKAIVVLAALVLAACSDVTPTGPATAKSPSLGKSTAPGQNKLRCFSGTTDGIQDGVQYGGTCTLVGGTKGPATTAILDNTDGDSDGSYSGVYVLNNTLSGKLLSQVTQLSFDFTGSAPGAGAPRFSLPVSTGGYAFIGGYYCNDGGHIDINNASCIVWYNGVSYPTWADFAASNPAARVGSALTFIIADEAGSWTVSNAKIG